MLPPSPHLRADVTAGQRSTRHASAGWLRSAAAFAPFAVSGPVGLAGALAPRRFLQCTAVPRFGTRVPTGADTASS